MSSSSDMEYLGRVRLKEPEVGLASAGERTRRHRPSRGKQEMSRCCKVFPRRDNWCRGVGRGTKLSFRSVPVIFSLVGSSVSGCWCPLRQKMSLLMLEASETRASPSLPAPDPRKTRLRLGFPQRLTLSRINIPISNMGIYETCCNFFFTLTSLKTVLAVRPGGQDLGRTRSA